MKNYIKLNLNINPLSVSIDRFTSNYHTLLKIAEVNPELISCLAKHQIIISVAQTFYSPSNYTQDIHIDGYSYIDRVKLNFVIGGRGSKMNWYEPKREIVPDKRNTMVGSPYLNFTKDDVELIDSTEIDAPTIVQVGIPHNIINLDEPRLCISLVLHDLQRTNHLTMTEACDRLHNYII